MPERFPYFSDTKNSLVEVSRSFEENTPEKIIVSDQSILKKYTFSTNFNIEKPITLPMPNVEFRGVKFESIDSNHIVLLDRNNNKFIEF